MSEKDSIDVFISYHMDSSTDIVEKISAALEGAGISTWYAKKDIDGGYAGVIVDAIAQCKVFLLILNQYSSISAHCLNEINTVFDRLSKREKVVILPFKIEKCELSKDAYYYLGRIRIMDGTMPPEMLRVHELIERIKVILGNTEHVVSLVNDEKLHIMKEYRLISSLEYPDTNFIGRKTEIEKMHKEMQEKNRLFLIGMGGIGKSEIAKMYCQTYKKNYDVIMWVSYTNSLMQTFNNDSNFLIQGLNRLEFTDDTDQEYFKRKINLLKEIGNERVLIIVDNFDVSDDPQLEEVCSGRYSMIFTSRVHPKNKSFNKIEITPIKDKEDLLALFRTEYMKDLDENGRQWVDKILNLLNGHPLSIRLVAGAMQSKRISPERMFDLLKRGGKTMETKTSRAADIIYGRLKQVFRIATLSEEEQYILKNLALIPLSGIEVESFFEWCKLDDYEVIDDLIYKNWVIHNPATDEVHLHPLIADLMLEELENDLSSCDELLETMIHKQKNIIGTSVQFKLKLKEILVHVCEKLPKDHPRRFDILFSYALILKDISLRAEAARELTALLDKTEDLTLILRIYSEIAHAYCLLGENEKAKEIAEKGLAIGESIPKEELTLSQATRISGLNGRMSEIYRCMGEYDLAVAFARKRCEECLKMELVTTPQMTEGWAIFHLASPLHLRNKGNDLEESEQLLKRAIGLFGEINDSWSQAFCHDILSQIYMKKNCYEQALMEITTAYDILLPQVGENHIDIANVYYYWGNIYRYFEHEEKAMEYYKKAVEILERLGVTRKKEKLIKIMNSTEIGYLS